MTWVERGADFVELVTGFEHTAFRWECQGTYREPSEREPFRLWQEGTPDHSFLDGWLAKVRAMRAGGKTFARVRMITDPPTEYLRWMVGLTHLNVEAGEDIRWLSEADARAFGAPTDDYYLLDDACVAILHFDENGVAGADVTGNPAQVERARRWQRLAQMNATPHAIYMSRST